MARGRPRNVKLDKNLNLIIRRYANGLVENESIAKK